MSQSIYEEGDLKNILCDIDNEEHPIFNKILNTVEDFEEGEIYFLHMVYRTTYHSDSKFYEFIGYSNDEKNLLTYINNTLQYFNENGTDINSNFKDGYKSNKWCIKKPDIANHTHLKKPLNMDKSNSSNVYKKICHISNKFDFIKTLKKNKQDTNIDYLKQCLNVDACDSDNKEIFNGEDIWGLKAITVLIRDKEYETNEHDQSIINDSSNNYNGLGASIFYIADNPSELKEGYKLKIMHILSNFLLRETVKIKEKVELQREALSRKNENIERKSKDIIESVKRIDLKLSDIKEETNYMNRIAFNFGYRFRIFLDNDFKKLFSVVDNHEVTMDTVENYIKKIKDVFPVIEINATPEEKTDFMKDLKEYQKTNTIFSKRFPIALISKFFIFNNEIETTGYIDCDNNVTITDAVFNGLYGLTEIESYKGYINLSEEEDNNGVEIFKITIENNPNEGGIKNLFIKVNELNKQPFDTYRNANATIIRNLLGISSENYNEIYLDDNLETNIAKLEYCSNTQSITLSYRLDN